MSLPARFRSRVNDVHLVFDTIDIITVCYCLTSLHAVIVVAVVKICYGDFMCHILIPSNLDSP